MLPALVDGGFAELADVGSKHEQHAEHACTACKCLPRGSGSNRRTFGDQGGNQVVSKASGLTVHREFLDL